MSCSPRSGGLDWFRLPAALLVVANHTSPLLAFSPEADHVLTQILARVAVPFFRTERVLAVRACAVWALTFGIALVFAPFGGVKVVVSLLRRPFRSKPEYTVIWYVPLRSLIVAIVLAPPFLLACAITIPRKMKLHHFVKNRTFLLQKIQLSQKMENLATLR